MLTVIAVSVVALFWNLGAPSLHRAEGNWAAIVFNMFDHGRVFILQIGQFDYYDKPFLSYWLMLICAKVVGSVSEAALRFPSALAAVGSVFLTYSFARRFFGTRVALHAALVLLSTSGFVLWGRIAQSEMLNLLGILAPLWLFFSRRDSAAPGWLYAMGTVMAVGSWAKGPLCFVVPGFVIVLYSLLFRDWKWFRLVHVAGAGILALTLYSSVFLLAWLDTGRWDAFALVYRENVTRLFSPWDHIQPVYYYVLATPEILAPWTVLLPWLVVYLVKSRKAWSRELKVLLLIIAGICAFFELSSSRRSYYLIPVLPFTAMLFGVWLESLPGLSEWWKRSVRIFWLVLGLLALVPLVARFSVPRSILVQILDRIVRADGIDRVAATVNSLPVGLAFAGLALIGVSWLYLAATRVHPAGVRLFVGGVCGMIILYFGLVDPEFSKLRSVRAFARDVATAVPRGQEMSLFPNRRAPAMVFYLQVYHGMRSYRVFADLNEARDVLQKTGGTLLTEAVEPLPQESWEKLVDENKLPIRSRDEARRRRWALYRPRVPLDTLPGSDDVVGYSSANQ
jgi:hypothetical protein